MNLRLLGCALVLILASCAYVDASTTQYVGVPRFPPSDPKTVEMLRGEPMQPHARLGDILLDISLDPAPDVSEAEQRLKEEAASWGANAVLLVRDQVMPGVGDRKSTRLNSSHGYISYAVF